MPDCRRGLASQSRSATGRPLPMFGGLQAWGSQPARRSPWFAALASIPLLAGCSGNLPDLSSTPAAPSQPATQIGEGKVKAGLILPLSASGNAAVAAQSMRNAAEMALAEFNNPDLQLLVKDDGGSAPGAQQAAQQVLDEGAEIILGPLFALTVGPVGRAARARGVPVIAFSTDTNVAARGVYRLCREPGPAVVRGARSGQCLWQRGGSSFQTSGGARRRPCHRARALSARSGTDAGPSAQRRAGR